MFTWALSWVWWIVWRVAVTLTAMLTLQHVIHEQDAVWIETEPMVIGTVLLILVIRIWSTPGYAKEEK